MGDKLRHTLTQKRLWQLLMDRKITTLDMAIFNMVDALSSDDEPCFASNEWFGDAFNITPNSAGNIISKLVSLGLLVRSIDRRGKGKGCSRNLQLSDSIKNRPLHLKYRPLHLTDGVNIFPSEISFSINTKNSSGFSERDKTMPFMKEYINNPKDDEHHQRSKALIAGLRKAKKLTGQASAKGWAVHFRRLYKDLDKDDTRLDTVLNWLIANVNEKYTPRVFSASMFRSKFMAIEEAMKRSAGDEPVEISETAQRIADRLRGKGWPKGSASDLPAVVQISLDEYNGFCCRLRQCSSVIANSDAKPAEIETLQRLLTHLTNGGLDSPSHFVENWMLAVHRDVADWVDWSGDLSRHAFRVDSKKFKRMGRSAVNDYCRDPKRWDRLMELMYAN